MGFSAAIVSVILISLAAEMPFCIANFQERSHCYIMASYGRLENDRVYVQTDFYLPKMYAFVFFVMLQVSVLTHLLPDF